MFSHSEPGPFKPYNNGEKRRPPKHGNLGHSTAGPFQAYKNIKQLEKNIVELNKR